MKFLLVILLALAACWSYIFFSGTGILISSSTTSSSAVSSKIIGVEMLHCKYFTGTEIKTKKIPYTNSPLFGKTGKSTCDRTIKL